MCLLSFEKFKNHYSSQKLHTGPLRGIPVFFFVVVIFSVNCPFIAFSGLWGDCLLFQNDQLLLNREKPVLFLLPFTASSALCHLTRLSPFVPHHRLLPHESASVPVSSRIHLRRRRHELPHREALLPGPHLHDRSAPCRCARRSGKMSLCWHQGNWFCKVNLAHFAFVFFSSLD